MDFQSLIETYSLHQKNLSYHLSKVIDDICDFNDPFDNFNVDCLQEKLKVLIIINSDVRFLDKTVKLLNELKNLNEKGV